MQQLDQQTLKVIGKLIAYQPPPHCHQTSPRYGCTCTLTKDHDGPHIAEGVDKVCEVWSDECYGSWNS